MTAVAATRATAAAPASIERWLLAGVAAELAMRFNASAGFIRVLLVAGAMAQPGSVTAAYLAISLLLPRNGARRPAWSGVVGVGRFLLLLALFWAVGAGEATSWDVVFASGPALWVPLGGAVLAGILCLLASGPWADAVDEGRCRSQVLGALPALAIAGIALAGMELAPDWRWERIVAGAAAVLGLLVIARSRHPAFRAGLVPAAVLAGAVLISASSGARLQGGTGDVELRPLTGSVPIVVRRAHGDVTLDLSALQTTGGVVPVRASVGYGTLTVFVPPDAHVSADLSVGRGWLGTPRYDPDVEGEGFAVRRTLDLSPTRGRPRIRLRIVGDVGIGELRVRRPDR